MSRKEVAPASVEGAEGSSSLAAQAGDGGSGGQLAEALARRRLYLEVTLALRTGLRDAKADFSFLRARGLRSLVGFLRSTVSAPDDSPLLLFRHSQSIPDLQGGGKYISALAFRTAVQYICANGSQLGLVQEEVQGGGGVGSGDDGVGGEHEPVGRVGGGAAGEQVDGVGVVAAEHQLAVRGAGPRPAAGVRVRGPPGRHQRLRQCLHGLRPPAQRQGGPPRRRRQVPQPGRPTYMLCFARSPLVAISFYLSLFLRACPWHLEGGAGSPAGGAGTAPSGEGAERGRRREGTAPSGKGAKRGRRRAGRAAGGAGTAPSGDDAEREGRRAQIVASGDLLLREIVATFHFPMQGKTQKVIPVLFQNSLHQPNQPKEDPVVTLDHIFEVEPIKISSPRTDSEIALALRVLEGCCLLYSRCTALAHKYKAVKVLLNILASRGPTEQGVCLDALISLMLDSPSNQIDFEEYSGLEKVAELLKDVQVEEHIRLKCGEFLLLLIGHVYAKENSPILEQMRNLFGEQCASLIWAASRFGSTLDAEQRQTALQIQARRVVESLEPY